MHRKRPFGGRDFLRCRQAARARREQRGDPEADRGDGAKAGREHGAEAAGADRESHQRGAVREPEREAARGPERVEQPGGVRGERGRGEVERTLVKSSTRGIAPRRVQGGRCGHQIEQDDEESAH